MSYLRGAAMKVGQTLANFPDIVPREFVETLDQLRRWVSVVLLIGVSISAGLISLGFVASFATGCTPGGQGLFA